MTEQERMQERIDFYCDADRRASVDKEEAEKYSPTLGEVIDVMSRPAA